MIYNDELFWQSLKVTLFYTAGAVPLGVLGALFVATLMYQEIPGRSFFLPHTLLSSNCHFWCRCGITLGMGFPTTVWVANAFL